MYGRDILNFSIMVTSMKEYKIEKRLESELPL